MTSNDALAGLVLAGLFAACSPSMASDALSGTVASKEEGPMEGVLVSAQRTGSPITITVVSDAKGGYRFAGEKLGPGRYAIRIRAIGYELEGPAEAEVKAGTHGTVDLRLRKAADLAAQLTNAEWMASVPGTAQEKRQLLNCLGCHTLERVVRSKYTSEEFIATVLPRMQGYVNQSMPGAPQLRKGERLMEERGDQRVQVYKELGDYLARINLSATGKWSYELKTFPRPAGEATRVVYTEYDLPSKLAQPHDVIVDRKGIVWYSSFGLQKIGRLDPATGAVKEYDIAISKPDYPTGVLALRSDRNGNLWLGNMYQASIARFDPATEKFHHFTPPPEDNLSSTQLNMVAAWNSAVDGKVWSQNNGFAGVHRFDLATGKSETWAPFKDSKEPHNIYDVISDSHNNAFFTDFRQQHIGRIDAKTGEVTLYETPTKGSSPRRGTMDAQDRLWFGEYRGHNIGMLDTATGVIKEWKVPTPYSAPYDVMLDKDEHAWTGSMTTDRIARLDTRTGQFVEYLLPRSTNVRRVFVDNSTTPPTFWVGNNHGASIVKLETFATTVASAADPATAALAPAGKLRVAVYRGSPTSLVRDPASGETKGVALDLGRAMAGKLGVPFEIAEFQNNAEALAAVKEAHADFAFTNATPARMQDMDFSPPLVSVEQGYLVPKGSPLANAAEVDRAGVKVGVSKGSTSERELAGLLHAATLVAVPTLAQARQMLAEGKLDAFATNKAILNEMADGVPGSRVLEGRYGLESFAIGVPKGREAGLPWLRQFAEGARADGTVQRAVERSGLRGTASF